MVDDVEEERIETGGRQELTVDGQPIETVSRMVAFVSGGEAQLEIIAAFQL